MVREEIVVRHNVSERGIEVDRAKIEVIEQLPPPANVKGIHSFLGLPDSTIDSSKTSHKLPVP
jgi:hypothetical protein